MATDLTPRERLNITATALKHADEFINRMHGSENFTQAERDAFQVGFLAGWDKRHTETLHIEHAERAERGN